jgi:hypothetical protein
MRIMAQLDVSGASANNYDSQDLPTGFTTTKCNTLYLINMSNLCYNVSFTGGSGAVINGHLPNNWARPFKVNGNYDRVRIVGANNPVGASTPAFSHIVMESYMPDEDVSHLADTPIPNPQQVGATSSTSTLSNEGNPSPTLVIDIGDINFSQLFTFYNDGSCLWAVDQAGVKHQVLRVNNAGTPLQLGQAGDLSEILGQMKVDQLATLTGLTDVGNLSQTGGSVIITGNGQGSIHLGQVAQGDIIDTSGGTVFYKAPTTIQFQIPSGTNVASIVGTTFACPTINASTRLNLAQSGYDHLSQFSGTGSGTFGTGLSVAPSGIYCDPCTVNGSSQTWGATIATSSGVTTGAGLAWFGQASH